MSMPRFQAGLHSPHLCGPYAAVPKGCERQDLQDAKEETKPTGLQVSDAGWWLLPSGKLT